MKNVAVCSEWKLMENKPSHSNCQLFHHHRPIIPTVAIHFEWHIPFTFFFFLWTSIFIREHYTLPFNYFCNLSHTLSWLSQSDAIQKVSPLKAATLTHTKSTAFGAFLINSSAFFFLVGLVQHFTHHLTSLNRVVIRANDELCHYCSLLHLQAVFSKHLCWFKSKCTTVLLRVFVCLVVLSGVLYWQHR